MARFDAAPRAIRCAASVVTAVHQLGLEVRAGVHTGESEVVDDKLAGLAVHVAGRVGDARGEVLVSQDVRDLAEAQAFPDAGEHELKGVPGRWHLYRLATS